MITLVFKKLFFGGIGFQEVSVVKITSQPSPSGISGYNIIFLLGVISLITAFIIKRKFKPKDLMKR